MRKFSLLGLLGLFAVVLCFSACSDDDDDNNNGGTGGAGGNSSGSLVGAWIYPDSSPEDSYYFEITFMEDGTYTAMEQSYGSKYMGYGTWSLNGNILTRSYLGEKGWDEETQSWIVVYEDDEPGYDTYTITFTESGFSWTEDSGDVEDFVRKPQ